MRYKKFESQNISDVIFVKKKNLKKSCEKKNKLFTLHYSLLWFFFHNRWNNCRCHQNKSLVKQVFLSDNVISESIEEQTCKFGFET